MVFSRIVTRGIQGALISCGLKKDRLELPSLFDNRIRCLFALGLMLAFLSDDTLADRILSETIVGDPVVSPLTNCVDWSTETS